MTSYSFSTSPGFPTPENLALIESDIDTLITDNTRLSSEIVGGTISITFSTPLSEESVVIITNIFNTRDVQVTKGSQIFSIYPMININTTTYKIIATFPFLQRWSITNIEISGNMDPSLTSYSIRIYNPNSEDIIAEKTFTNDILGTYDMGPIANLPSVSTMLEIDAKITGESLRKSAYIESIIIYYD